MTEKNKEWGHHEPEMKDDESPAYMAHKEESPAVPPKAVYKKKEMPTPKTTVSYGHSHGMSVQQVEMKTEKKVYHAEYTHKKHASKMMCHPCPPVICEPQYVFHDHRVTQEVPVMHPIIHVHRYNIVPVPKHYYQHYTENPEISP